VVPAHPAPRDRPRAGERLSPAAAHPAAAALRQDLDSLSRSLRAAALQQELRHPPRRLVRAEPSRRGLRRDLRGLAGTGLELARSLPWLAGAHEARLHGLA